MATRVRSLVAVFMSIYMLTSLTKSVRYKSQNNSSSFLPPKSKTHRTRCPIVPLLDCGAFFITSQGQQEFRISANSTPSKQCERINKNYTSLTLLFDCYRLAVSYIARSWDMI